MNKMFEYLRIVLVIAGVLTIILLLRKLLRKQKFVAGEYVYKIDETKFYQNGFNTICRVCQNITTDGGEVVKIMYLDGTIAFVHKSSLRKCDKQDFSLQVTKEYNE